MILKKFPAKETFRELAGSYNIIPVCAEVLADTETPVSVLQKFYDKDRPVFLLESVEGGERWARYSFLGISAHREIKIFEREVEIISAAETQKTIHHGEPLKVISRIMAPYNPAQFEELPRFWSGLTGYITYEMVGFFEKIPVKLPDDTPYAHFIIPEQMIVFDNMKHTLTCLNICYLDGKREAAVEFENALSGLDRMIDTIGQPVYQKDGPSPKASPLRSETDPETYKNGVNKIKQHIIDGDIIQAVYSQPFTCTSRADPVMIYRGQRHVNPSPYMFFMNFSDFAIAGSSPETMVRLENFTATLRPIAGTRPRGKTEQEDRELADELLTDEKERAEHLMLVDLARNDLGRVAKAGTVQVTDTMFIERYSHVMHLVSNITCDMQRGMTVFDLLKAVFPAGTLSGAPKIRAMEIIAELEHAPRKVYGGAAGYISFSGNMDMAITIRTAVIEKGKVTVQAGAGIVADSDPARELEECINKAKSVDAALQLAAGQKEKNNVNSGH